MTGSRAVEVMEHFDGGLAADVQPTRPEEVASLLKTHYGLEGALQLFGAERDEIFGVTTEAGKRYVLKIHSPAELPELADLRLKAMRHIVSKDPALPIPKIIPARDGDEICVGFGDGTARIVHLMTYLDGAPQAEVAASRFQARHVGETLARITIALAGFHHPAQNRYLVWDLANANDLIPVVPNPALGRWAFVHEILKRFAYDICPRLSSVRTQVVHNDFNPHNLFVDPHDPARIVGVIDFGDICQTQIVNDLAIAACYQLRLRDDDILAGVGDVVAGYCALHPLEGDEFSVLFGLILVRLAIAVTITEWRAHTLPRRATSILKNTTYAWKALERLQSISPAKATERLRAACL